MDVDVDAVVYGYDVFLSLFAMCTSSLFATYNATAASDVLSLSLLPISFLLRYFKSVHIALPVTLFAPLHKARRA